MVTTYEWHSRGMQYEEGEKSRVVHNLNCEQFVTHADYKALEEKYLSLEKTSNAANYLINRMTAEINEVSVAIGTTRYLDLPDGGSVSLGEQVKRMHAELAESKSHFDDAHQRWVDTSEELAECRADAEKMRTAVEQAVAWPDIDSAKFNSLSEYQRGYHRARFNVRNDCREAIDSAIARSRA